MDKSDFLLLQINDALFPIGGYSHSYGLETYIQKNFLKTEDDIKNYIISRISNSLAVTELLGSRIAYENADNIEKIKKLDNIITVSKSPEEIRQASLKMGSRFIKTLQKCNLKIKYDYFEKYSQEDYAYKNHCTAYGIVCAAANINKEKMLSAYLYSQCSAMITNCVKTVPLSQTTGQKILYDCNELMEQTIKKAMNMSENMLCISAPAFDIRCMEHEKLYSRLYMS